MPLTTYGGDYYYFRPYNFAHVWKEKEIVESWGLDGHYPSDNRVFEDLYEKPAPAPKPVTQFSRISSDAKISSEAGLPISPESTAGIEASPPWQGLSVLLPDSRPEPPPARQRPHAVNPSPPTAPAKNTEQRRANEEGSNRYSTRAELREPQDDVRAEPRAGRTSPVAFELPHPVGTTLTIKSERTQSSDPPLNRPAIAAHYAAPSASKPVSFVVAPNFPSGRHGAASRVADAPRALPLPSKPLRSIPEAVPIAAQTSPPAAGSELHIRGTDGVTRGERSLLAPVSLAKDKKPPVARQGTVAKPAESAPSPPERPTTKFEFSGYVRSLQDENKPACRRRQDDLPHKKTQAASPVSR
jgi:hypothetical protein